MSTRSNSNYGPNVDRILAQAIRLVRGRIPAPVRKELMSAVKAGVLGHLKKDGLKPEVFFHPDHRSGAIDRRVKEAEYAISCITRVIATKPVEERVAEALNMSAVDSTENQELHDDEQHEQNCRSPR